MTPSGPSRKASSDAPEEPGPDETEPTPPNSSEEYPSGMDELEREIAELLLAPVSPDLPGQVPETVEAPAPTSPPSPPFSPSPAPSPIRNPLPNISPGPSSPSPSALSQSDAERLLRAEILRLRAVLDVIRRGVAEHRAAVADVHGEIDRMHSVLNEMRTAGEPRGAPTEGSRPSPPPAGGAKTISAAPVFFMDPEGRSVQAQAFFTLGKGGALESFLTRVLNDWEGSGYPIETKGGVEGFSLVLLNDPEGRSLRLLPSGMYLMQLGRREIAELQRLPPLVSSKSLPKHGGLMRGLGSFER